MLTLQASASNTDISHGNQLKSDAILEKLFEQNPQHPGVSHFIIHAYDFLPLAYRGIAAAKRTRASRRRCRMSFTCHRRSSYGGDVGGVDRVEYIRDGNPTRLLPRRRFHRDAHLQLAQDVKAKALIEKAIATPPRGDRRSGFGISWRRR